MAYSFSTGTRLGNYEILEPIGRGGMGEVYRARDTKLGREVALKVLPEEFSKDTNRLGRFEREAKLLAQLNHTNIATLHGLEESDGQRFLVMELVRGEQLGDYIAGKPLAPDKLIELGMQVADALRAAHLEGIVHRDIKPSNIIVTKEGNVIVLDFGLAKHARPKEDAGSEGATLEAEQKDLTGSGAVMGTVSYMSPEQVRGEEADFRSDIFSLGSVLYEMATGRRAFSGSTAGVTFEAILNRSPLAPADLGSDLPEEVERVIVKALEKDPDLRYQSAADLRTDLKRIRRDAESSGSGTRRPVVEAPSLRRPKLLYGTIAIVAAGALALVLESSDPLSPPSRSDWVPLTNFTDSATSPALSPDGRMLTFLRGPDTFFGLGQVYVKMLPDGDPVAITGDDLTAKMTPHFSADGALVAFTMEPWDTWVVPVLGGSPRLFLPNASGLSWIDRTRLLYSQVESGNHMGIVVSTESRTDAQRVYLPAEQSGMAHRSYLSPDGEWVIVAEMDELGWMPCRLVPFNGGSSGTLVGPPAAQCRSAAWSPDGGWIYLTVNAGDGFHIWRQRLPDGGPEQVTSGPTEEMGIAMAPDGRSFITSVGAQQSTLWIHEPTGERQMTSEGFALVPELSTDGKLYYLVRSAESRAFTAGKLWVLDLESGRKERLLPDFVLSNFDVSSDGARIVFVAMDANDRPHLWVASLDRRLPPREVPSPAPSMVGFGVDGELFVMETEGSAHFIYRMNESGGDRRKIVPVPVTRYLSLYDNVDVSMDGRFVAVEVALPAIEGQVAVKAFPVDGGDVIHICNDCSVEWDPAGKFLFVWDIGETRGTYALPIPMGASLPRLPENGIRTEADALEIEGVLLMSRYSQLAPGPDPTTYAFVRTTVHRNLYRIPISH